MTQVTNAHPLKSLSYSSRARRKALLIGIHITKLREEDAQKIYSMNFRYEYSVQKSMQKKDKGFTPKIKPMIPLKPVPVPEVDTRSHVLCLEGKCILTERESIQSSALSLGLFYYNLKDMEEMGNYNYVAECIPENDFFIITNADLFTGFQPDSLSDGIDGDLINNIYFLDNVLDRVIYSKEEILAACKHEMLHAAS